MLQFTFFYLFFHVDIKVNVVHEEMNQFINYFSLLLLSCNFMRYKTLMLKYAQSCLELTLGKSSICAYPRAYHTSRSIDFTRFFKQVSLLIRVRSVVRVHPDPPILRKMYHREKPIITRTELGFATNSLNRQVANTLYNQYKI